MTLQSVLRAAKCPCTSGINDTRSGTASAVVPGQVAAGLAPNLCPSCLALSSPQAPLLRYQYHLYQCRGSRWGGQSAPPLPQSIHTQQRKKEGKWKPPWALEPKQCLALLTPLQHSTGNPLCQAQPVQLPVRQEPKISQSNYQRLRAPDRKVSPGERHPEPHTTIQILTLRSVSSLQTPRAVPPGTKLEQQIF